MRHNTLAFLNKTGTGTSDEVTARQLRLHIIQQPIMAKLTLSYGATPTITVKLEGWYNPDQEWIELASDTFTSGTPKYLHVPTSEKRCKKIRLNIIANSNVTVDSAHIGVGTVEN